MKRAMRASVPPFRNVEVEQDWQVVMLAQLLTNSVENCFTVSSEATEDQHRFRCDGVDNVADLLVVEQQIDELRDLDVVDSHLGLVLRRDDQVLLLGPVQF
jgi:hypothetical protein